MVGPDISAILVEDEVSRRAYDALERGLYTWLAWHRFPLATAGLDVELCPVPVLLAALLDRHGTVGPAEVPAKRAYTIRDVMRCAREAGLTCTFPPGHPFNPLLPLRACAAVPKGEARRRAAGALLDATWSGGHDVTDPAVVAALLGEAGLDGPALVAAAATPEGKARLRQTSEDALARGVFGVPTFAVGGELFWGHDRLDHLAAWLRGGLRLDEAAYQAALARPGTAVRRR